MRLNLFWRKLKKKKKQIWNNNIIVISLYYNNNKNNMENSKLKNYKVVLTRGYSTSSAAHRFVRQYEQKNGVQNTLSDRKQFLVEKIGVGSHTVTLFDLRRKI